jgi:signal transduction histidine kinase
MTPLALLLVDDDEIDREQVRRFLGAHYVVHEASTGYQALQVVKDHSPACILLDYRLPDIDGLQLLPEFTKQYIPVIILTGEESPEIIVQAMQLGAQDYLVKNHLSRVALEHAITNAIEKIALRRDIEQKNQQVRALASALTLAEQRERRRISQILHDHVQQMLYGIQMRAHLISLDSPSLSPIQEHLESLEELAKAAIRTTRSLTVELSPPVLRTEGLVAAFQWLAHHMADMYGLQVNVVAQTDYHSSSGDLQVLLFQLVRELLFNVVKHAGVNEAEIRLYAEGQNVVICVSDQGCGFDLCRLSAPDQQQGGFGLYSVRERLALFGGELTIQTKPGEGVRAIIGVPRPEANEVASAQSSV